MERVDAGGVTSARGFRAAGVTAGIKASGRPDLAVLVSDTPAVAAGVFTTNRVRAYNVDRSRRLLAQRPQLRAVVVNSGNANVATGEQGRQDTDALAAAVAHRLGCDAAEVAVAQTGVIGVKLPINQLLDAVPALVDSATDEGGHAAAEAICTTDTRTKESVVRVALGSSRAILGAMAKGAGMIHPNLATLLCFVATDAAIAAAPLRQALDLAVDRTLNCLTIDGDQSTSDTCLVLANGAAGNEPINGLDDPRLGAFTDALTAVLEPLAMAIARDGEGAGKLLRVQVTGAGSEVDARVAARAVAASSLVKCAVHGNDPNWGRIACAVGYSGAEVAQERLTITLNNVLLMFQGEPCNFDRAAVSTSMMGGEVVIRVDLGVGRGEGRAFGCDLTEAYVRFNAEYTT